jgi:DNA-binding FadR family transcriptional regulator
MKSKLTINSSSITLVDQIEEKLRNYFKEMNLMPGDTIPTEAELAESLGVARSVLREALSRLKMLGLIASRTKRGIILTEPDILTGIEKVMDPKILSHDRLIDILGIIVTIEIGMVDYIVMNMNDSDLKELENIVKKEKVMERNRIILEEKASFHPKLYEMTGNPTILRLCKLFSPVYPFLREHYKAEIVAYKKSPRNKNRPSHEDLLNILKERNAGAFREAMKKHLEPYFYILETRKSL